MAYTYERFERATDYSKAHYDEKKTHTEMCLDYLKRNGSITPLEALTAFNSFRLAAQICKLRKAGYVIKTEINDTEPRFAIYTLMKEERNTMANTFEALYPINVNDKTETKEGLTYLSWAWAWAAIKAIYPEANYNIKKFGNNLPYVYDENTGYMVFTDVTIDGLTHEMWLPVMDSHNKAMKSEPYTIKTKYGKEIRVEAATMFDINKTIMRCLVKNLAVFGLGLYIYAGQDLPDVDMSDDEKRAEIKRLIQKTNTDTAKYLYAMGQHFKKEFKSVDEMQSEELDYALGKINEKARAK